MDLNSIYKKLQEYKNELNKSAENGTNSEPDGSKEEKTVNSRISSDVANMNKDDDIDKKIQDKIRAAMDKKGFGEADATRHVIDRDRGEKEAIKPKPEPLLQTELIKFDDNGQWSLDKSNYGPKDMELYSTKDNIKRKSNRTSVEVEGAGGNKAQKEWASGGRDSTKNQLARQVKTDQEKSAQQPVKVFSEEEKVALQTKHDEAKKIDYNGNMRGGNENDEG